MFYGSIVHTEIDEARKSTALAFSLAGLMDSLFFWPRFAALSRLQVLCPSAGLENGIYPSTYSYIQVLCVNCQTLEDKERCTYPPTLHSTQDRSPSPFHAVPLTSIPMPSPSHSQY